MTEVTERLDKLEKAAVQFDVMYDRAYFTWCWACGHTAQKDSPRPPFKSVNEGFIYIRGRLENLERYLRECEAARGYHEGIDEDQLIEDLEQGIQSLEGWPFQGSGFSETLTGVIQTTVEGTVKK